MGDRAICDITFIGTKQAIVNFINRGLAGAALAERVSTDMSYREIVDILNSFKDNGICMDSYIPQPKFDIHNADSQKEAMAWCYEHYGCQKSHPIDKWQVLHSGDKEFCIITLMDHLDNLPIPFLKNINGLDGVTVYSAGVKHPDGGVYMFNGRLQKVSLIDPYKDPLYEQYLQQLDSDFYESADEKSLGATEAVMEHYSDEFDKEICKELSQFEQ